MNIKNDKKFDVFSFFHGNYKTNLVLSLVDEKLEIFVREARKNDLLEEIYFSSFRYSQLILLNEKFKDFSTIDKIFSLIQNSLHQEDFELITHVDSICFLPNIIPNEKTPLMISQIEDKSSLDSNRTLLINSLLSLNKYEDKTQKFDLTKIQKVKEINQNPAVLYELCLLNDGRIAASFDDCTIKILDLDSFECECTLRGHTTLVFYISLLSKNRIVSSSADQTIKIWEPLKNSFTLSKTLEGHSSGVIKVIEISENRICSCSGDKTIKVWSSEAPYQTILTIRGHDDIITSIIELKSKKYIVSGGEDKKLCFWNSKNFTREKTIDNIYCNWNNSLIETNYNKVIVGGRVIYIINLDTFGVEKEIEYDRIKCTSALLYLGGDLVLCGCRIENRYSMLSVNIKTHSIVSVKEKVHDGYIRGFLRVKDSNLLSWSEDRTVKEWKI